MSNELITQIDTQALIRQRDLALDLAMRGMALLAQAKEAAWEVHISGISEVLKEHFVWEGGPLDARALDKLESEMRRKLDASAWDKMVRATGLYSFMDEQARKKWAATIEAKEHPVFEPEAIQATLESLYEKRHDMLDDNLIDVYRRMSWDRPRSVPLPMHAKAKVEGFTSIYGHGPSYGAEAVKDLLRILTMLDGKRPDREKISSHVMDGYRNNLNGSRQFENDYFTVRYYKNGKADLTFKRQDLLDKLNDRVMGRTQALLDKAA